MHGSRIWVDRTYLVVCDALVIRLAETVEALAIVFGDQFAKAKCIFFELINYLIQVLLSLKFCSLDHPFDIGISLYLGAIKIQFFPPHQPSFNTQFHNVFKELLEDF